VVASKFQNDGDPVARHSLSPRELKELLAAERAGQPFLAFRDLDGGLSLFVLGEEGKPITIGRRAETDLSIPWDGEVSGLHAELQRLGGEWTVIDDGLSTNGTFVNGERISGRQRLRDGDRVRVGRTVLAYNAAEISLAEQTTPAGERLAIPELTGSQRRVLVALCRPYRDGGSFATPASNQTIAEEVFLSVDAVKMHLRTLFGRFHLTELPQNQKRARLAELALQLGVVSQRDLA
jgi:pSer/pThr/pTyr-binding forkhead associated (FHA) protein